MATYKRKIALCPKGTFSASSTYAVLDVVSYNGASYVCTTAITTAAAWDASKWQKLCQDGTNGTNGSNGTNGTDAVFTIQTTEPTAASLVEGQVVFVVDA